MKEITQKVMKEEGWSFAPRTNKRVNKDIANDVITRNSEFLNRKQEKLKQFAKQKENEFHYMPNLISKQYNMFASEFSTPVQDRLYNKAMEIEMKKEKMRRDQIDENWTFKPQLAKMTDQILLSKSIFSHNQ
jgi:hypothetical protein